MGCKPDLDVVEKKKGVLLPESKYFSSKQSCPTQTERHIIQENDS